jgi:hypothetical protein
MARKQQDKIGTEMPYTSRHFYRACLKLFGDDGFFKFFKVGVREAYRWGANPRHCEDIRRNPLEMLEAAVEELDILGEDEIALTPARVLAAKVRHRVVPCECSPDGENMHHEMFQGNQAVSAFYRAIDGGVGHLESRPMLDRAIKELEDVWDRRRREESGEAL